MFLRFFTGYSTEDSLDDIIEVSFTSINTKDVESIFSLVIPYEVDDEEIDEDFDPAELY